MDSYCEAAALPLVDGAYCLRYQSFRRRRRRHCCAHSGLLHRLHNDNRLDHGSVDSMNGFEVFVVAVVDDGVLRVASPSHRRLSLHSLRRAHLRLQRGRCYFACPDDCARCRRIKEIAPAVSGSDDSHRDRDDATG